MRWPLVPTFVDFLRLPAGVVAQQLGRDDLAEWTAGLSAWHPDLAIGEESSLLSPAMYIAQAALRDEPDTEERDMYTLVLRSAGALVGGIVVEFDRDEATLAGRMSVVSPAWRGRGLGRVLLRAQEALGRGLGARSEWGLVELDNTPQQHLLESEGMWLCGIVPESDQRRGPQGQARYVPEALYIKPFVPVGELLWPQRQHLIDEVAALFDLLQLPGSPVPMWGLATNSGKTASPTGSTGSSARPHLPRLSLDLQADCAMQATGLWPDVDALLAHPDCDVRLPPGYRLRAQTPADIAALTGPDGLLARWHPGLLHGTGQALATAAHHHEHVAFFDAHSMPSIAARPYCHLLLCREGQPVAFCALSVDEPGVNLFAELGVVDPQWQGQGLMVQVARAVLWIAVALRVETVLAWATLAHVGAQRVAQRAGLSLWGVVPASEVAVAADGRTLYAYEALFGASLIPADQAHWPDGEHVRPHVRALAQRVRGG